MVKLSEQQQNRRIELYSYTGKRVLNNIEKAEQYFLDLLFQYQEKGKSKQELKKHINKLYAANKSIKQAEIKKEGWTNYQIDMYAIYDILQQEKEVLYKFFNLSYEYIK